MTRDTAEWSTLDGMKWLPRPSFRAVALVGTLAAIYVVRNSHKELRRLAG
jgi:protease I